MKSKKIQIYLPCLNEEKTLETAVTINIIIGIKTIHAHLEAPSPRNPSNHL